MSIRRPQFLVQVRAAANGRVDDDKVQRLVQYLGGVPTQDGFSFHSAEHRLEALQMLSQHFDERVFVAIDVASSEEEQ